MERIVASGIVSSYGRKLVLDGAGISADAGQCVGIVGANGCGKSTLLNILSGLRDAKSGDIFFDGCRADKKLFKKYTGYVPQESNLISELSVRDNLLIWYRDGAVLERGINSGFLKEFGIGGMLGMKAGRLSGGMKKRVSIACALGGKPPVLILDEPCAALDLFGKDEIRKYLVSYKQRGGTVVMATHEESDLDICDKIYALKGGRCRETDISLRGEALLNEIRAKGDMKSGGK